MKLNRDVTALHQELQVEEADPSEHLMVMVVVRLACVACVVSNRGSEHLAVAVVLWHNSRMFVLMGNRQLVWGGGSRSKTERAQTHRRKC